MSDRPATKGGSGSSADYQELLHAVRTAVKPAFLAWASQERTAGRPEPYVVVMYKTMSDTMGHSEGTCEGDDCVCVWDPVTGGWDCDAD